MLNVFDEYFCLIYFGTNGLGWGNGNGWHRTKGDVSDFTD